MTRRQSERYAEEAYYYFRRAQNTRSPRLREFYSRRADYFWALADR